MSVDGIGFYVGLSNYKVNQIQPVTPQQVKQEDEIRRLEAEQQSNDSLQKMSTNETLNQAPRMADLEDISLTFINKETLDYIGKNVAFDEIDMEKAISDLEKDKVLEQYQYFVKPKDLPGTIVASTTDGTVIQK